MNNGVKLGDMIVIIPERQNFVERFFKLRPRKWIGFKRPSGKITYFDEPLTNDELNRLMCNGELDELIRKEKV